MTLSTKKLDDVIQYFAGHDSVPDLGMVKLWKLIFYADATMARDLGGESITGSEYIKYPHGPVPSRGEKRIKRLKKSGLIQVDETQFHTYQLHKVSLASQQQESSLSEAELNILSTVADKYGRLSANELSIRSHEEPSWIHANDQGKLDPMLMLYGPEEDPEDL